MATFQCDKNIQNVKIVEDKPPKDTKLGDYMVGLILGLIVAWIWMQ